MHNVLHIAGLRKRLASFGLMLVLLGSLFIPYGQLYSASAAEQSVRFKNLKTDENGIVQATNGKWYKVLNGNVDRNANSIYPNGNGWWKCTNGEVTFHENGVFQNQYGWWYCQDSKVDFSYTGFGKNYVGQWRIENGKVNFNANSIYQGKTGWFKTTNGQITYNETGVFQNTLGWWYCENSKVNFDYNGVASNYNGDWYCRNGKVDFHFNGYGRNKNGNWCICEGKVQNDRNEALTIGTRNFTIQDGRIRWEGNYFLQPDAPYSNITYAKKSLATSGCGPVSLVNAIYCLNGIYIPVEEVANWGYNNKYFNADSFGGISKKEFFTKAAEEFGSRGSFRYIGYGKDVQDATLLNHLQTGGTAVLHVKYHFIAVIDFDPETNQYFILDSYPGTGTSMPSKYRTTTAEGDWVTLDELKNGWLTVSEYWMYGD